jgi:hypothetical protein
VFPVACVCEAGLCSFPRQKVTIRILEI